MPQAYKYVICQMINNDHEKYQPIAVFDEKHAALNYIQQYGNHDKLDFRNPNTFRGHITCTEVANNPDREGYH